MRFKRLESYKYKWFLKNFNPRRITRRSKAIGEAMAKATNGNELDAVVNENPMVPTNMLEFAASINFDEVFNGRSEPKRVRPEMISTV